MDRHFEALGLKRGAGKKEIKQAYRTLVKAWHPDRFSHDPSLQIQAQERTKIINEAYRYLMQELSAPKRPAAMQGMRFRVRAEKPRRFFVFFLAAVFACAAVFGVMYGFLHYKENAKKLIVDGVSFGEWEWDRTFKVGSTEDEVLAVQGPADQTQGGVWHYGNDWVRFVDGRVQQYSNQDGHLKVKPAASSAF